MKSLKLIPILAFILSISFACNEASNSNELMGTWRCYEITNSYSTISYDSSLCSQYDQLHHDPMQYRFLANNTVAYMNLGGACSSESFTNYKFDRHSITIGNTTYTLELLNSTQLHFRGDAMTLYTLHKYVRTQ